MLDRLTSLWERYSRIILGALVAVAAVAAVAYFTIRSNETQEVAASEKLAQANSLFWQGDYDRSKTIADEVARQYGGTPSGIDALRISGDDAYWRGNWKDAITQYRAYLGKKGTGLMGNVVRRSLAYAYESDRQYAEAAKLYDGLVGAFDRESSGEFLAGAARCQEALGNKAGAIQRLQRLTDEFGETSYASRARVKLAELRALSSN
ncbi:MAG: tetratricopeptide repeat protein [Candidatus Eisenbacteria bacterium]|nr:tetratricopeptide repeat protein [Candidatus Eisenbacteria bacterium]